jgi:putative peptidoglycan lipid II flippase
MLHRILNSQTKTITSAAFLLGISALASRLLGLFRDRLLAGNFGAGQELDIYFAAFRIPDFVYGILIMGGISAVFLPVFSEYFSRNEEEAWELTNNILNCFFILLILSCGILAVFAPWLVGFVAPGFDQESRDLTTMLTRIMFLSPIFFGLSSIFSGILHYFNRFLIYSLAPVLYNLGIIFGIIFLVQPFGLLGLGYGVVLGAFLHWLVQIPAAKLSGFKYSPVFNFRSSKLLKIFKLMIPRTLGTAAYHINLIVITAIASTLTTGSITVFNFSNNLQYLPIGLIGASFALASFPALSRSWLEEKKEEFLDHFSSVFRQIIFLIIPISLLMFLLRAQIIRLILGTGQFGWVDTRLTAASLGLFSLGIFAFSLIPFLVRVFYSFQDTRTPVIIGVSSMFLNVVLALFLVWLLKFSNAFQELTAVFLKLGGIKDIGVLGLPLALSVSGIFQVFLLLAFLRKRLGEIRLRELLASFQKIILASSLMAVFAYFTLRVAAAFTDMQTFFGVFIQTALALGVGILVYLFFAAVLKSPELKTLWTLIKTRKQ